jgi:hypothetical protein
MVCVRIRVFSKRSDKNFKSWEFQRAYKYNSRRYWVDFYLRWALSAATVFVAYSIAETSRSARTDPVFDYYRR